MYSLGSGLSWMIPIIFVIRFCIFCMPLVLLAESLILLLMAVVRGGRLFGKVSQAIRLMYGRKPIYTVLCCAHFVLVYAITSGIVIFVYYRSFFRIFRIFVMGENPEDVN